MKIIGIIPARYASSRFPGKSLIDLKGKSMIQRVYEGAGKSAKLSEVIVATDDERIFQAVKSFGGEVMMTSNAHTTGTDRCGEVSKKIGGDVVINIQGDEPLVDFRQLDALCEAFDDDRVQIATLGTRKLSEEDMQNPNRIKLVQNYLGDALYFSRSAIPNTERSGEVPAPLMRHIGLYGYRADILEKLTSLEPTTLEKVESLEQLRWLYYGYKIRVVETDIETPNIDVPEDVKKVLDLL